YQPDGGVRGHGALGAAPEAQIAWRPGHRSRPEARRRIAGGRPWGILMKVIVCGAGQVGTNIARHLATENNNVTIIDQEADLVRRLSETLDVQAVVGHASSPPVLEAAGAGDADLIIAVTYSDEV